MNENGEPEADLSQLELEFMNVIWALQTATTRQIQDAFNDREVGGGKSLDRSTIATYLDRLTFKKRYLRREPGQGREFIYFPLVTKQQVQERTLRKLMETFDSDSEFLHRFAGAAKLSPQEQKELRQIAERLRKKSKP